MSKYKNKDGIKLSLNTMTEVGKIGSGMDLVQEVVSEAVKLCSEYDWSSEYSMRIALQRTRDFLIENFNLEDNKNGR